MRKVREVLRLRHALGLSYREISEALGVGKTSAGEIVRRAEVIGLTWPLPQLFDDGELERRLFTAAGEAQPDRPAPDWAKQHEELKRRGVTLVLLWQEYRAEYRTATATAGFAISTASGATACRRQCAKPTRRARSCSWILPATRLR
jgi:transposase